MSSLILTRKDLFFRFAIFGLLLSFLFTPVGASDESVENSNGQAPEENNSGQQSQVAVRLAPVKTDHP